MAASEWVIVRMRMQDAHRFIADARAAGASIRTMGRESGQAAGLFERLTQRSFWLQQGLFTVRRVVYGLTLALGGLGSAVLVMGFNFNSVIEQQTLAFERFTGSAAGATREISYLFDLAARTPFEFQQVIAADRQLMAFGFTAQQTRPLIEALSDAMAGMGLDQSALDRATLALGQIRSTGRLLGQDLRQLEQLGLVSPEDLAKRLGVPLAGILQPGELQIPSEKAIDAIVAYWQTRFKGAAADFQKTWVGRISTLHDIGAQTFGAMVLPLQKRLEDETLPLLTRVAQAGQKGFQRGGMRGFFEEVDRSLGAGTQLATLWNRLSQAGQALFDIVSVVAKSFLQAWRIVQPGLFIFPPLIMLLRFLAFILTTLQPLVTVMITLWVAERTAVLLLTAVQKARLVWDIAVWFWTVMKSKAESVYIRWLYLSAAAQRIVMLTSIAFAAVTAFLTGTLWAAVGGFVALTVAFLASPIGWVVLAVIGLAAAFVILYKKWDRFRETVQWLWDKLKQFWGWLQTHDFSPKLRFPRLPGPSWLNFRLTDLWRGQSGGIVPFSSSVGIVGERGPELVNLPGGTQITPIRSDTLTGMAGAFTTGAREVILRIPLIVDGRELAEATARYDLNELARA